MKPQWNVVLVGILTVGLWASAAAAQQSRETSGLGPWAGGGRLMLPVLVKGVGLTDAQQGQVKQIVGAHQPQFRALVSQLRALQEQLADKLQSSDSLTAEGLAPLTQQMGQVREQLTREGLQVALEIRAVLTPEQLAKAGQIRRRLNALRGEMRSLLGEDQ